MKRHRLVVLVLVVAIASASAHRGSGRKLHAQSARSPRVVHVTAERFLFVPSEIRAEVGEVLEIRLTSDDTNHGFRLVGSNVNVEIPKRRRGDAVAVFDAKEAGDYAFECSRMCGAGHSLMRGSIRVRPQAQGRSASGSGR